MYADLRGSSYSICSIHIRDKNIIFNQKNANRKYEKKKKEEKESLKL